MNTNLVIKTHRTALAAALLGCLAAGPSLAQQQLDTRNLGAAGIGAADCAEVAWNRELLVQYPRIAEGCQEVIISNGEKWARFEANLVRADRDGSVTLEFNDRQGRSMDELTLMPAADQRVRVDGREYEFAQLTRGQLLNFYVPEGIFAVAVEPGAPAERRAAIMSPGALLAQAESPAPGANLQPPRADALAPRAAPIARQLPSTAGPLPFILLAGLISLLGGLGLTITRRFGTKKGTA